jgi:hypothetical protein
MPTPPIYIPISSPDQWKALLAEPEKHWRTGYSAKTIAHSWLASDGIPPEILALFASSGIQPLAAVSPLLVIPEHKVLLPPSSGHPSQNDVFVLAKGEDGSLVSITVEGKVAESFGPTIADWLAEPSKGKDIRFAFLKRELSLPEELPPDLRYQLLHRLASATLEAKRFDARHAVMIVHSFSPTDDWLDDFRAFLALFGAKAPVGTLSWLFNSGPIGVYAGWAQGDSRFLAA